MPTYFQEATPRKLIMNNEKWLPARMQRWKAADGKQGINLALNATWCMCMCHFRSIVDCGWRGRLLARVCCFLLVKGLCVFGQGTGWGEEEWAVIKINIGCLMVHHIISYIRWFLMPSIAIGEPLCQSCTYTDHYAVAGKGCGSGDSSTPSMDIVNISTSCLYYLTMLL